MNTVELSKFEDHYLMMLETDLKGLNLTRIVSREDFHNKQIIDSLIPLLESPTYMKKAKEIGFNIDIGFGGGFPLLPLAVQCPEIKVFGFEARGKKAKAVQLVADKFGLKNVKALHQRFDDVLFNVPSLITFKAVGRVDDLLNQIHATKEVTVYFLKGPNFDELEGESSIPQGWELFERIEFDIPGTEGRLLLGIRNVPRGTKKKSVNVLVKLSDIV